MDFNINQRATDKRLRVFAEELMKLSKQIGFHVLNIGNNLQDI